MKYRFLNKENKLQEIEVKSADTELLGLVETETNNTIYKNDIIRINGIFKHVIWWNKTKKSSGRPQTSKLTGYAIYQVLEGGEPTFEKLKLLKSEHTWYNMPNNVYYLRSAYPQIYDWEQKKEIKILGNTYFSNVADILSLNGL